MSATDVLITEELVSTALQRLAETYRVLLDPTAWNNATKLQDHLAQAQTVMIRNQTDWRHQPLEFPARPGRAQSGSSAGGWLLRCFEACAPDARMLRVFLGVCSCRGLACGRVSIGARYRHGNGCRILGESALPQDHVYWFN
jgi:hypothetical protein